MATIFNCILIFFAIIIIMITILFTYAACVLSADEEYRSLKELEQEEAYKMNLIPNKYNLIVAADENWCIGKNGGLLDHFAEDMKLFKAITKNKAVIMGDRTQDSLPKKYLPNRVNIVLSMTRNYNESEDNHNESPIYYINQISAIPTYIKLFNHTQIESHKYPSFNYLADGDVFIIGGGMVYRQFLENDLVDTIYLTQIHHKYDGDTFIPNLWDLGFKIIDRLIPTATNENGITYDILVLKK